MEKNHRTIKCWAAKSGCNVKKAVFWYNFLPKEKCYKESRPCNGMFKEVWRFPKLENEEVENIEEEKINFGVGDLV